MGLEDWKRRRLAGETPALQAVEGEAGTAPRNFHALWRGSASWGLTSAATFLTAC